MPDESFRLMCIGRSIAEALVICVEGSVSLDFIFSFLSFAADSHSRRPTVEMTRKGKQKPFGRIESARL